MGAETCLLSSLAVTPKTPWTPRSRFHSHRTGADPPLLWVVKTNVTAIGRSPARRCFRTGCRRTQRRVFALGPMCETTGSSFEHMLIRAAGLLAVSILQLKSDDGIKVGGQESPGKTAASTTPEPPRTF